jgi:Ca-activated chloride channel homolog
VTTLGLGLDYNEDLLVGLAKSSDGNHAFVESANDLPRIFGLEFGDLLSAVAKEITITIRLPEGVRPVRVLGRDAEIIGQTVIASVKQLYGQQEKYLLLEVELPARIPETRLQIASLEVAFFDLAAQSHLKLEKSVDIRYSILPLEVEKNVQRDVMVAAVEQIANDNSKRALMLRDQGLVEKAREALNQNQLYLHDNAERLGSDRLHDFSKRNQSNLNNLDENNWQRGRKAMKKMNYEFDNQQAW